MKINRDKNSRSISVYINAFDQDKKRIIKYPNKIPSKIKMQEVQIIVFFGSVDIVMQIL